MTKLLYPKEGIYSHCKDKLESCENDFLNTKRKCQLDIPDDFYQRKDLNNLPSKIEEYSNRFHILVEKLNKLQENMNILSSDLLSNVEKLETSKITERNRLIY